MKIMGGKKEPRANSERRPARFRKIKRREKKVHFSAPDIKCESPKGGAAVFKSVDRNKKKGPSSLFYWKEKRKNGGLKREWMGHHKTPSSSKGEGIIFSP